MQEKQIGLELSCPVPSPPDMSDIHVIEFIAEKPVKDYLEAMKMGINWQVSGFQTIC
ncbi:MAG: hypothetical protein M3H12_11705 [Chromatiales bacterium]|nr:hypothetical protein [Gammaproteobacteria bacterium]